MAVTLDNLISDGDIEVIVRSDSALDVTDEEYGAYAKTLDENLLKLKVGEEPTRWVMRKKMDFKQSNRIENAKVRIEKGDVQIQLSFMALEVQAALKGIKSPDSVPVEKRLETHFKRLGDGLVSEDFMSALGSIVQELYTVRNSYLEAQKGRQADIKKS